MNETTKKIVEILLDLWRRKGRTIDEDYGDCIECETPRDDRQEDVDTGG